MHVFSKNDVQNPIVTNNGETIYEIVGRFTGEPSSVHSVAHIRIAANKATILHYHPETEESYYILKGKGRMVLDDEERFIESGQVVLIPKMTKHKLYNLEAEPLEMLAVCVPAWEPTNTVWLEEL
jgi:mannose-6-phosphate isomerase-like protein (cupin superfamily)